MKDLTKEWIKKAERDAGTATRESLVEIDGNWDAVCFHAQQAVEKYIKGLLQEIERKLWRIIYQGRFPIRWGAQNSKPEATCKGKPHLNRVK